MDSYNYSPNGIDYDPDLIYPSQGDATPRHQRHPDPETYRNRQRRQRRDEPQQKAPAATASAKKPAAKASDTVARRLNVADWGIVRFFCDRRTRAVFGVILICIAVYVVIAAISYLRIGGEDESAVVGRSAASVVASGAKVHNQAGPLGATIGRTIFTEGLGLGSRVGVVYLVLLGLSFMGIRRCNFWSMTFKSLLVAITLSLVLGLVTLWCGTELSLGGYHGQYMNQLIISYGDWAAAILVSLVLVVSVVYVYLNDILKLIASYRSLREARRAKAEQAEIERAEAEERVRKAMAENTLGDDAPAEESAAPAREKEAFGFEDSPEETHAMDAAAEIAAGGLKPAATDFDPDGSGGG